MHGNVNRQLIGRFVERSVSRWDRQIDRQTQRLTCDAKG